MPKIVKPKPNRYSTLYSKNFDLRSIYVWNVPLTISDDRIKLKFSRFGNIENISIKSNNLNKWGSIQYEKSESAYMAIKQKRIGLIYITENWNKQPIQKITDFDENCTLEHLNDYCLLHIYSYLELHDQLSLSKISNRQKSIFQSSCKLNKSFDLNDIDLDNITLYAIKNYLMENGKSIETFVLLESRKHPFYRQILHCVLKLKCCPNVKTLALNESFQELFIELIENACPNLEHLVLTGIRSRKSTDPPPVRRKSNKLIRFTLLSMVGTKKLYRISNSFPNLEILDIRLKYCHSKEIEMCLKIWKKIKKIRVEFDDKGRISWYFMTLFFALKKIYLAEDEEITRDTSQITYERIIKNKLI